MTDAEAKHADTVQEERLANALKFAGALREFPPNVESMTLLFRYDDGNVLEMNAVQAKDPEPAGGWLRQFFGKRAQA